MYAYEITYWDEVDNKELNDHGFVYGADYADAAQHIAEYYGEKNIIELKLFALEHDNVIPSTVYNIPSYEESKKTL